MLATNPEIANLIPYALALLKCIQNGSLPDLPKGIEMLFQQAFQKGGLDKVDNTIDSLNEALDTIGAPYKFREGCALQELGQSGRRLLHLFVESAATGEIAAKFELKMARTGSLIY